MLILSIGVGLWAGAHLIKRLLPDLRARLGNKAKGIVAALIVFSIILMIIGYQEAPFILLYELPLEVWYLNNVLMFLALFLIDIGRVKGVVRTKIRHPMLTAVKVWAFAHLLVNGDAASVTLFGGMLAWAVISVIVINKSEPVWEKPEPGSLLNDGKILVIAAVIYVAITWLHAYLGRPPFLM